MNAKKLITSLTDCQKFDYRFASRIGTYSIKDILYSPDLQLEKFILENQLPELCSDRDCRVLTVLSHMTRSCMMADYNSLYLFSSLFNPSIQDLSRFREATDNEIVRLLHNCQLNSRNVTRKSGQLFYLNLRSVYFDLEIYLPILFRFLIDDSMGLVLEIYEQLRAQGSGFVQVVQFFQGQRNPEFDKLTMEERSQLTSKRVRWHLTAALLAASSNLYPTAIDQLLLTREATDLTFLENLFKLPFLSGLPRGKNQIAVLNSFFQLYIRIVAELTKSQVDVPVKYGVPRLVLICASRVTPENLPILSYLLEDPNVGIPTNLIPKILKHIFEPNEGIAVRSIPILIFLREKYGPPVVEKSRKQVITTVVDEYWQKYILESRT